MDIDVLITLTETPVGPLSPNGPGSPFSPGRPGSPLSPGTPLTALSPGGPGGPYCTDSINHALK